MNKDMEEYIYGAATGMPGNTVGGVIGAGLYQQEQARRQAEMARTTYIPPSEPVRYEAPAPPTRLGAALSLAMLGAMIGGAWGLTEGLAVGGALLGGVAAFVLSPVIYLALRIGAWLMRVLIYLAVGIGLLYLITLLGGAG